MSKPIFQDILPPEKRSIKKIPIPDRSREKFATNPRYVAAAEKKIPSKSRRKFRLVVISFVGMLIIGTAAYSFLSKVSGATIKLTPKGKVVLVDAKFSATTNDNDALSYQIAVYEKDGKLAILATGEEPVAVKATGVIRIFNSHSGSSQKLVANTRFEAANGKIFRISNLVIVPGKVGDVPGSVDATVTAEVAGTDYNVGLADFTIPGFKGDPKYVKIFARSKSPIIGGYSGARKKVDQAQADEARQKIRNELQASFVKQMRQNVPDNFVFLTNGYFIEYQSLPDVEQNDSVILSERAIFHGVMFKRQAIAKAIADKVGGDLNDSNDLYATETLILNAKVGTSTTPWENDPLIFNLKGTTTLISATDIDKLKAELAGKPRKSLTAILAGYPSVGRVEVIIRPFWKQNFPEDPKAISIEITPSPVSE